MVKTFAAIVTKMGMGAEEMDEMAEMINAVLKQIKIIGDTEYNIDESFKKQMKNKIKDLCSRLPVC